VILEVFLLLSEKFVFPGPEGLDTESLFLSLDLVFFEDFDGVPDELNITHPCSVALTQAQVLNSGKASLIVFESRDKLFLNVLNSLCREQSLFKKDIALIVLDLCTADHALDKGSDLLSLLSGRGDAFVCDQVGGEVSEHGLAVLRGAVEFANLTLVPHFLIIVELLYNYKRKLINVRLIIIIYQYKYNDDVLDSSIE
jgi:hypothetical protein